MTQTRSVLCVTTRDYVTSALENALSVCGAGHVSVIALRSGAEALRAAGELVHAGRPPAACIADVELNDIHGVELLYAIQVLAPHAATALLAAPDEMDAALEAVKNEATDRIIDVHAADARTWALHAAALLDHAAYLGQLHTRLQNLSGRHLFVTGSTGFLGTRFLRDVLRTADVRVTALSRGSKDVPFDQRLPFGEAHFPGRLAFVEGDVREESLGIAQDARNVLLDSVDEVWHLAALTTFDEVMREATFAVNLEGTKNTLAFARGMKRLKCFHHVSTAFVCGADLRDTPVLERLNARPASFRNPYEESKYLAELAVAEAGLPYAIYRPSIILGERVSGRCDGQTVYNIAKMVRLAKLLGEKDCMERGLPLDHHSFRVVANTASRKNMIPVDRVISMMLGIRACDPPSGRIFHLTHEEPVAIGDLVETLATLLDASNYEIVDSLDGETLSVPEAVLERVAKIFRPYMTASDPTFDTTNARHALGAAEDTPISKEDLTYSMDAFYSQYFGPGYRETAART